MKLRNTAMAFPALSYGYSLDSFSNNLGNFHFKTMRFNP